MTQLDNIACVAAFLVFLEHEKGPKEMWGGRTVNEAINAFSKLCDVKPERLRELSK